MGREARERHAKFKAAIEALEGRVAAAAERRSETALRVPVGEASLSDYASCLNDEEAAKRLLAEIRAALPQIRAAAETEEVDEREAPERAARAAKADAKCKRDEALWRHPNNALRIFEEEMGTGAPDHIFSEARRWMRGGVRDGNVEAGEPRFVVANVDALRDWCADEHQHLAGWGWANWLNFLPSRHGQKLAPHARG